MSGDITMSVNNKQIPQAPHGLCINIMNMYTIIYGVHIFKVSSQI